MLKRFLKALRGNRETGAVEEKIERRRVSRDLDKNVRFIKEVLYESPDLVCRNVDTDGVRVYLVYFESITDKEIIQEHILKPLGSFSPRELKLANLQEGGRLTAARVQRIEYMDKGINAILDGMALLVVDGIPHAYAIDVKKVERRNVAEPSTEPVVKGPHEGFIEDLEVNISHIRKRLPTPSLKMRRYVLGKRTRTPVVLFYMRDIAKDELVDEIEQRILAVDKDGIPDSGYLEQLIEDNPYTIFPQMLHTERPERAVSALLEGRVVILVGNSPSVLMLPADISCFYHAAEDYTTRWIVATFTRWLRFASFFVTVTLPSVYIAVISYHLELAPFNMLIPLAQSRTRVPFPPALEALIMEATIELLREAGIRLPRLIGQTISIVGGLVIGEAAVRAGLVSHVMVIVVSITAISSFIVPSYDMGLAVRLTRFPMMIFASLLGFAGIAFGYAMLFIHLCVLESVGVAMVSPLMPYNFRDWKDVLIRAPLWLMRRRPSYTAERDRTREGIKARGEGMDEGR